MVMWISGANSTLNVSNKANIAASLACRKTPPINVPNYSSGKRNDISRESFGQKHNIEKLGRELDSIKYLRCRCSFAAMSTTKPMMREQ